MQYAIATFGSHSALQILKGAQQEGFKTICICIKGKEKPYQSFRVADEIMLVDSFDDFFSIEQQLIDKNAILIPHASMIAHFGIDKINKIKMHYFGDKSILQVESNRNQQEKWLAASGLRVPKTFEHPEEIDRPCIVKFYGAQGGNNYFLTNTYDDFKQKIATNAWQKYQIQEYIVGVPTYIHYFYSPLTNELELFGFDRRYESNVDGIGRIAFHDQANFNLSTSYTVAGNSPLVVRESLLPTVFDMGQSVVQESKKIANRGLYGAFCLETMITSDLNFYVFEISARIVAGTNVSVEGSPYTYLRYDEPMSTGRRIAREIKQAITENKLDTIVT
jgi:5-formaminoimidazole-4-carboxamide-1-(beta)-D-ribofuranosyl 5'-monophosphate synthetase